MGFYEYTQVLQGVEIVHWEGAEHHVDLAVEGYRIAVGDYDDDKEWLDYFDLFLQSEAAEQTRALVIGIWGYEGGTSDDVVQALTAAHAKLPRLEALFVGDILQEENEVSWIEQTDMAVLFTAYPRLKTFYVRGGTGLSFGHLQHEQLQTLVIQSGGLGRQVVADVLNSRLPELQHLEFWLGAENYGANSTAEDFRGFFAHNPFPKLKYLGLRNSEIADELTVALKGAPIVQELEVLDLSKGILGDEGAKALLENLDILHLKLLDLHHHYMSNALMEQFQTLKGVKVNLTEQMEEELWDDRTYRYVSVGE